MPLPFQFSISDYAYFRISLGNAFGPFPKENTVLSGTGPSSGIFSVNEGVKVGVGSTFKLNVSCLLFLGVIDGTSNFWNCILNDPFELTPGD